MNTSFCDLKQDALVSGFRAKAIYRNGLEQPMGGRFIHEHSGFTLDLIEIQSVPQSFVTVNTFPVSNMGEPHTQEHLLLGKGNVGRAVAAKETMSMVESTAFTQQLKTCYPFAANAGLNSYFEHFDRSMNALLHPDYTDEEIRREVRNFGVKSGADGKLALEEKGSIYVEMQSAVAQPGYRVYRAMGRLQYGPDHPMSFDSGGDPVYIRAMKADDIRRFHAANYHLANIEMVASLPRGLALEDALSRFDRILTRLQADAPQRPKARIEDLPPPKPTAAEGTIQIVGFPSRNPQQAAPAQLAWPPMPRFHQHEESLAGIFAEAVGGDPSTNLYKIFIDSRTRKMDIGARAVAMGFDNESYAEFTVYIPDLAATQSNLEDAAAIRALIQAEFERIAAWPDDSPELLEFHGRMQASLVRLRRSTDKLTSSPPGFGARAGQSAWPGLLRELAEEPGFEKSLVQPVLFAYLERIVNSGVNVWRDKIRDWRLVETSPYIVIAQPMASLVEDEENDLKLRLATEVERLKISCGMDDEQQAIRRYQQEYDAASAELDRLQSRDAPANFIDKPPMSLDEQLDYDVKDTGGITLVVGKFAGMNSATLGIALSMKELQGRQLVYAAILPQLLSGAGLTKDGETLDFEEAMQRVRREILGVGASCYTNPETGRIELVLTAAGNTIEESKTALDWMRAMLLAPNWSIGNLARIKDVIDQAINTLRTITQRSEEHWVNGPADAWTHQDDPLLLSVSSFHTRLHHLHRLRWMLTAIEDEDCREALARFFGQAELLPSPVSKDSLDALIEAVPPSAKPLTEEAAKDLLLMAREWPSSSAAADWQELVRRTCADLLAPIAIALAGLEEARLTVAKQANARLFLTASPENAAVLEPLLAALAAGLSDAPATAAGPKRPRHVARRVMARENLDAEPAYVGLLAASMQGGVHLHSAPFVSVKDPNEEAALNFLAAKLYGGAGSHGIFMKTWSAGLAYSNGLRSSAIEGRISYYAERNPELTQTIKFVIGELKNAPRDLPLSEYALAQVFAGTRAGGSFEGRTSAMAADLADGLTPTVIQAFRQQVLDLRKRPDLNAALYARMDAAAAKVLPGYDGAANPTPRATYFVIGPEKQLASWEAYLGVPLQRLYPRDYWVMAE